MPILEQLRGLDSEWEIFEFWDKSHDGSCPCFSGKRKDGQGVVRVWGKCWRVSDNGQDLYIWGDHPDLKKIARATKKLLDATEWYQPYTIIYENPEE